jgi:hypothetical protein
MIIARQASREQAEPGQGRSPHDGWRYRVKIETQRVEPTKERSHGIK